MEINENLESNACIDWFKFACVVDFDEVFTPGSTAYNIYHSLCENLILDPNSLTEVRGTAHYDRQLILGADVSLLIDAKESSKRSDNRKYFIVDLSGSACREFERRGGSWHNLLEFYMKNFTYFEGRRIDIALDDYNYMNLNSILRLIRIGAYSGMFRFSKPVESINDFLRQMKKINGEQYDRDVVEKLKKSGDLKSLSVTFGSKNANSIEFQIYDKLLERLAAGKEVDVEKWTRFEMRFFKSYADDVNRAVYEGMTGPDGFAKTAKGIISSRFNLLSHSYTSHSERVSVYKPWADFLGSVERIPVDRVSEYDVENAISRTIKYVQRSLKCVLLKTFCNCDSEYDFSKFLAEQIVRAVNVDHKLTQKLLCEVNSQRLSEGKRPETMNSLEDRVHELTVKYNTQTFECEEEDYNDLPF